MEINELCDYKIEFGTGDEGKSYTAYIFVKMKKPTEEYGGMKYKFATIAQEQADERGLNLTHVKMTVLPMVKAFTMDVTVNIG